METNCGHEWIVQENKNICNKCGKSDLFLKDTKHDGLKIGIKSNGLTYSVRTSRYRYFFPNEWEEFKSKVSDKNKIIFEMLLITGGRINEVMMIKKSHLKLDNKYLILFTTKIKSKKNENKSKQREITLPKHFIKTLKTYCQNFKDEEYIFLNNERIKQYGIKKISRNKCLNVYQMFKRSLNQTNIDDKWNFSLHNIRKTCGMWLKTMNVRMDDICFRMGHDPNTYIRHYGSTDRFEQNDKNKIMDKFSGIYGI